jgi:hypothetical protein
MERFSYRGISPDVAAGKNLTQIRGAAKKFLKDISSSHNQDGPTIQANLTLRIAYNIYTLINYRLALCTAA